MFVTLLNERNLRETGKRSFFLSGNIDHDRVEILAGEKREKEIQGSLSYRVKSKTVKDREVRDSSLFSP